MFRHLHLIDAAREQRRHRKADAAETSGDAQDDGGNPAPGIAPGIDYREAELVAVRAGEADGLTAEVGQELVRVGIGGGGCICGG
eukprot:CAMPEP_0197734140 /NCGR_PEP_ID=MMETSP1434-20131217/44271_1 /TAXON_ID=265543 /ORGANISM="Minutocellus polymorphus, Strain CCMP3303" /LENGTH=84 /DNA_ID=CAMNT_0043321547 /DNA_START=525 /DNA_END=775 /DNA_ORIENTATION=+